MSTVQTQTRSTGVSAALIPQSVPPTVRRGDKGPDVVKLQQALIAKGLLSGVADGNFGSGTLAAVEQLQRQANMTADGVVGRKTWELLLGAGQAPGPVPTPSGTTKTLRSGDEGPEVRELQQLLISKGFLSGSADGKFGNGTREAVANFQERNNLRSDGSVGPQTWAALRSGSSVGPGPQPVISTTPLSSFNHSRVDTQMPSSGPHHMGYYADSKRWGTAKTVELLKRVAASFHAKTGKKLEIGDISLRGGGDIDGHKSHERGTNVDINIVFNDGRGPKTHDREGPRATFRDRAYDRSATRTILKELRRLNPSMDILFNDPVLIAEGLCRKFPNHDNHIHITVR